MFPPLPPDVSDSPDRDACIPRPVPPSGGDPLHNYCAKHLPGNAFPGADVLVNGKRFDALQPLIRLLWEIKTDNFDTYKPIVKKCALDKEVPELLREAQARPGVRIRVPDWRAQRRAQGRAGVRGPGTQGPHRRHGLVLKCKTRLASSSMHPT